MRLHRVILAVAVTLGFAACSEPPPDESSAEQALLVGAGFTPSTIDFGSLQVGQSTALKYVSVYPTGNLSFSAYISNVIGCPGFTVSWSPGYVARTYMSSCAAGIQQCPQLPQAAPPLCDLPEDEYYTFAVAFNPTVAQSYSCAIQLVTDNGTIGTLQYTVKGVGTPPPKAISLSRTSIGFGDVRVNTSSTPATVTIQNTGGQTVTISGVTASAGFAVTPTGATTLAQGTSKNYSVTCSPTSTTTMSGQLTFAHDATGYPTTVSLSCRGIDSQLDISPSPLVVTTRVGEPLERSIRLTNTGQAPMDLSSVTIGGDGVTAVQMPGATQLAYTSYVEATVRVDATTAGEATGTLTATYDGMERTASITANVLATSMALAPDGAYDFGAVCVGQSRMQHVTVKAAEAGWFRVDSVSEPGGPFSLSATSLPADILGGGENELGFDVSVAPQDVGAATSSIDITTDIPGAPTRSLALSVTGLPAGVSATPAELDLGPSQLDKTTLGGTVEVMNCGEEPVTLSNPRIEGDFPDDFAIVSAPDSLDVDANGKAQWLVVATPRAVGTRTAKFVVDQPDGTASVDLITNGVTDGPSPGDDDLGGIDTSYYACSTGTASAAWPLLLALVPLLRRRKRR